MSGAPYGYRYVRKTEHTEGYWEIDEVEAQVVREVFRRYTEEQTSIAEIARWLSERGIATRTGKGLWDRSTVWGMLRNPAYRGQAAFGKTKMSERHGKPTRTYPRPRRAPRPPPGAPRPAGRGVDADPRPGARHRRAVRARPGAPRRERPLRQAQHQAAGSAAGSGRLPRVRLCLLSHLDAHYEAKDRLLPLHRPGQLAARRRARVPQSARSAPTSSSRSCGAKSGACWRTPRWCAPRSTVAFSGAHRAPRRPPPRALERDLSRAYAAIRRLIEAYQEQLVSLDELRARMPALRKRQTTLQRPARRARRRAARRRDLPQARRHPRGFLARLADGLDQLSVEEQQRILRLVVREVLVGGDDDIIAIRHSIPSPNGGPNGSYPLRGSSPLAAAQQRLPRRPRSGTPAARAPLRPLRRRPDDLRQKRAGGAAVAKSTSTFIEERLKLRSTGRSRRSPGRGSGPFSGSASSGARRAGR